METLFAGAELLMRWDVVVALLIGSIGGVIIGVAIERLQAAVEVRQRGGDGASAAL